MYLDFYKIYYNNLNTSYNIYIYKQLFKMDSKYYGLNTLDLFTFVTDAQKYEFLISAHQSITACELWDWLRIYEPSSGFMFDVSLESRRIHKEMEKYPANNAHSGSSYSLILREMQYIAKYGYQQYAQNYIEAIKDPN